MSDTVLKLYAPDERQDSVALRNAIRVWADGTTNKLAHNPEALPRDKRTAVESFFTLTGRARVERRSAPTPSPRT
jgi:hypothetical protein